MARAARIRPRPRPSPASRPAAPAASPPVSNLARPLASMSPASLSLAMLASTFAPRRPRAPFLARMARAARKRPASVYLAKPARS